MALEQDLRARIAKAPLGSTEKNILRVVLGELQLKGSTKKLSDSEALDVVKKMVESNKETLAHLHFDDPRRAAYLAENQILLGLLPPFWTKEQIREVAADLPLKEQKSEGQAIGAVIKKLKSLNANFNAEEVKQVVVEVRGV